jgi:mRNA-degrading endonuclease RelE of RelBE toxin-antitoxin system
MKQIAITYSKQAQKFLTQKSAVLTEPQARSLVQKAMQKLLKVEENNSDVVALHGELQGLYRVRKGDIRIIFGYRNDELILVNIERIDWRGQVYS